MRRFHNWVKSEWLRQAVEPSAARAWSIALLDFGCGFGGDLHKWNERAVADVLAVDPSLPAIEEARQRDEARVGSKTGGHQTRVHWIHDPCPLTLVRELPERCVEVVTVHFCLHYYARDQQAEVLRELARILTPTGCLIVTFMEGKRVLAHTTTRSDDEGVHIRMVSPCEIEVHMRLDNAYFHSIPDGTSREHLVFSTHLVSRVSPLFHETRVIPFEDMYAHPRRGPETDMTPVERRVSFLHTGLLFCRPRAMHF